MRANIQFLVHFLKTKKDSTYSCHLVKQYLEDLEEEKTLLFAKKPEQKLSFVSRVY